MSGQQALLAEQDAAQEVDDPYDRKSEYTYEELLEMMGGALFIYTWLCHIEESGGLKIFIGNNETS